MTDNANDIRNIARVVLLNQRRILLMNVVLPTRAFWCTIGGGVEAGETLELAAKRELREETGLESIQVRWHGILWFGEHWLERDNRLVLHRETFFLAETDHENISCKYLTDEEKKVVKALRWWTLEEVRKTSETIFPSSLKDHLGEVFSKMPLAPKEIEI